MNAFVGTHKHSINRETIKTEDCSSKPAYGASMMTKPRTPPVGGSPASTAHQIPGGAAVGENSLLRSAKPRKGAQAKKHTRITPDLAGLSPSDFTTLSPSDEQLIEMFGVKTSINAMGLYISALQGLGVSGEHYRSFAMSMCAELEPKDAIEAMLVIQIGITHAALMTSAGRAADANAADARESYDRIMNRLARTFAAQVEAFRRHRLGGAQTVRVEHVTVNAGGQAIVGSVRADRRGTC